MADPTTETREEFEARYPRPQTSSPDMTRVLVRCCCGFYGTGMHWAWGWWDFESLMPDGGLPPEETLAEDPPVAPSSS